MSALCIATRGVICGGGAGSAGSGVTIDVSPLIAAQHLRPTTTADYPVEVTSQGTPLVAARELRPKMIKADSGVSSTSQSTPEVISTDDLRPVMRKAEEQ